MVAPWVAPVVKSAVTIWGTIATIATTIAFPPLGPVVGGIFAVAGTAVDQGFKGAADAAGKTHNEFVEDSLRSALKTLDHMNVTLHGIENMLNKTSAETRETLKDIQLSLKTFEDNMNRNFDELKQFTIEKDFIEKIQLPMKRIWDLMQTASDLQTKDSVDRFIMQYKQNPARNILAEFINRLDFTHTNPISAAMENHVFQSRFIMDHYVEFLSQLIFKVLAIEGFYFGVAELPNNTYPVYMDGLSKEVDNSLLAFRAFYTTFKIPTEKYWPSQINQTIFSNNDDYDKDTVADKIGNILYNIYTTDVFSIYVLHCPSLSECLTIPLIRFEQSDIKEKRYELRELWTRRMVMHANEATNNLVMVLRSEKFHEFHAQSLPLLRTSFRSYASLMNRMGNNPCITISHETYPIDFGKDPFLDVLEETFKPNIVHGFVSCGPTSHTMTARFTNNGTELLTDEEADLLPKHYELVWI